jgi:F-type H+-transporting ATPase subunit delta
MSAISNNDIARAVYLLAKGKSHVEQADISKKVVRFLFKRRLLSKAPQILSQLEKIINKEEGRVMAKVGSVEKLSHQTKTNIEQALKKRYSAKEIVIEESLDARLLGGIKVEVNNEVIDLSIKNRIGKLQEYLTSNHE